MVSFRCFGFSICRNFLFVEEIKLMPKDDRLYCSVPTQEIHVYFASNGEFVTSLNKVFVSKYLLVIFLLPFIHSFQVFFREPDKPLLKKKIVTHF